MTVPLATRLATLHQQVFVVPAPWSAADFAGFLGRPEVFLIEKPAGFLLARAVAGEAEVLTLAVDPTQRRQGVARALLTGFWAEACARDAEDGFLEVAESNHAARALYAATGWDS